MKLFTVRKQSYEQRFVKSNESFEVKFCSSFLQIASLNLKLFEHISLSSLEIETDSSCN